MTAQADHKNQEDCKMEHEMMNGNEAMGHDAMRHDAMGCETTELDAAAEREKRRKRAQWIFISWRVMVDYSEEDELQLYRLLCRGKHCLALVGNSQEDHCVYSAWVAFEMVRYYDRDIEALEEMRRYLATKADQENEPTDWRTQLSETISGFFGKGNDPLVTAAYYRDALDVITEIVKLRKGLKTYDGTLG